MESKKIKSRYTCRVNANRCTLISDDNNWINPIDNLINQEMVGTPADGKIRATYEYHFMLQVHYQYLFEFLMCSDLTIGELTNRRVPEFSKTNSKTRGTY